MPKQQDSMSHRFLLVDVSDLTYDFLQCPIKIDASLKAAQKLCRKLPLRPSSAIWQLSDLI